MKGHDTMKKLISALLVAVTLFVVMAPLSSVLAAEAETSEATPIIYVRGNGNRLYNDKGQLIATDFGHISLGDGDEDTKDTIIETASNILLPFLTEGLILDEWDN